MADPQVLGDIDNIKIPYPTEGVIRTAQLDDTVAPPNSAQLAVNMNFDRVGAIMTRPGVKQYANTLGGPITNFGTLHNELVPPGYENLAQLGTTTDFQTTMKFPSLVKVSDTQATLFWTDSAGLGWVQNLTIDETTGDMQPIGTALNFEGSFDGGNSAILINSTTVLNVWTTTGNHGHAQTFNVSGESVTANGSPYDMGSPAAEFSLAPIQSGYVLCVYAGTTSEGLAVVLAVDGSGNVSEPGSVFTYDSNITEGPSVVALGDGTHFVNFWLSSSTNGTAQVLAVNTSTWAVTAVGSPLANTTAGPINNALSMGDNEHFVNVCTPTTEHPTALAFNVNLSTFAVTAIGTPLEINTGYANSLVAVGFGDGKHFLTFFSTALGTGYVQMIAADPSTYAITNVGQLLAGYDFANNGYTAAADLTNNVVMVAWGNVGAADGQGAMFISYGAVVEGRWLYASVGGTVYNMQTTAAPAWTSVRSGLKTVGKPRFAQFLNYLWMVNGNQQIGGDPVATSNGGAFGTDLVPANFPAGDYIHGGFEGRVWVADATLGIIYYTDIVQFTPPDVYTLTYNEQVNFITTIAPQTGETFTGFVEVPRALLIFTQNTITRIYGATSIDAYPAYNVGTYSQESIVTVKNGIYFHHSSGFYQFTPNVYAAQPTEISRRIIDFIKAIPRSNYENIVGVYDWFDNIEWAIGQVTVEGVTYKNCVVRFTISTQVWTIYDYIGNAITAMIEYDDGTNLNHLMGTSGGQTGQMDVGNTDFGASFYFEFIDRWRSFTDMYYLTKRIDAVSVYHDNAGGANLMYQQQGAQPNAWEMLGAVTSESQSIVPNGNSNDFNVIRLRLTGTTKGVPIIVHGFEILQITQKGQSKN